MSRSGGQGGRGGGPKRGKGGGSGSRRRPGPKQGRSGPPTRTGPPNRRGQPPVDEGRSQGGISRRGLGGDQVEGRQAVRELLIAGIRPVREILFAAGMDPAPVLEDIVELAAERRVTIHEVARRDFDREAVSEGAQGVLARAQSLPEHELDDLADTSSGPVPFLVVLDGVTDPGNLGALLRSAEGAGVTGVILPRHRAVHITPTVAKAAAGAIEFLPMALVGGLPAALTRLTELGVWVVGLDGDADLPLDRLTVADEPVALVLGAEGSGLSRLVRQRCDAMASIPMYGNLNSLNVSAAAAVALFDVAGRRGRAR
ncbi:MAG: 23S rRNA (guanosine(2251)-2'-O)-methyltransferase RlmB [Actinomycetia bacterium]|nr:23S rRNA (guanosine(2251)-2'-O)-methyltransferase RlmB [Actinomycetes bacterium]MCP3910534.1 23S rRNA (guanosine(2251)-2'-O)-methyltransferase RlmB [Actinomycetes bacterium]MCP4088139.1 23S rRNA (guanosine(2251)-2'-O)-methyltransferase RlmB [Actinomycetes bacterium]